MKFRDYLLDTLLLIVVCLPLGFAIGRMNSTSAIPTVNIIRCGCGDSCSVGCDCGCQK